MYHICKHCKIFFIDRNPADPNDKGKCPECNGALEDYDDDNEEHLDIDSCGDKRAYLNPGDEVVAYEHCRLKFLGGTGEIAPDGTRAPRWEFVSLAGEIMHAGCVVSSDGKGDIYI